MAKKFRDLVEATLPPEAIAEIDREAEEISKGISRDMLQHAVAQARALLASDLNADNRAVEEFAHKAERFFAHLKASVEQMGGSLEIVARFPGGDATIESLAALGTAMPVDETAELRAPAK